MLQISWISSSFYIMRHWCSGERCGPLVSCLLGYMRILNLEIWPKPNIVTETVFFQRNSSEAANQNFVKLMTDILCTCAYMYSEKKTIFFSGNDAIFELLEKWQIFNILLLSVQFLWNLSTQIRETWSYSTRTWLWYINQHNLYSN